MFHIGSLSRCVVGLASLLLMSGCAESQLNGSSRRDFALRDLTGRTVRLSDYLGRDVVLLSFWASWCAPCAAELPELERLYRAHRDKGFVVLGIAMDGPETVANVAPIVRRNDLSFPIMLDEETRVVGVYNPKRTAPLTVLIGRDSSISKMREGYTVGDATELESEIVALLEKRRE